MTNSTLITDLEHATQIAKEGRASPLLGGEIGLTWTALATVALMAHGTIIAGWMPIDGAYVGLVWLIYAIIGTLSTSLIGRRLSKSCAPVTLVNKASWATWSASTLMIFAIVISIIVAVNVNDYTYDLFNMIVPLAFSVAAVSYSVLARLSQQFYLKYAAIISGCAASITMIMLNEPQMYFVAGVLLIMSGVIPSVIEIRKARAA